MWGWSPGSVDMQSQGPSVLLEPGSLSQSGPGGQAGDLQGGPHMAPHRLPQGLALALHRCGVMVLGAYGWNSWSWLSHGHQVNMCTRPDPTPACSEGFMLRFHSPTSPWGRGRAVTLHTPSPPRALPSCFHSCCKQVFFLNTFSRFISAHVCSFRLSVGFTALK